MNRPLSLLPRAAAALALLASTLQAQQQPPIDRHALVSRHNVVHRTAEPKHFLQVGNGEFAYGFDVTGMQTLDRAFDHPIPLATMSNWGWHSFPNKGNYTYDQTLSDYDADGRKVTYSDRQNTPAGEYFRSSPHRVNLARIGLWWEGQDESGATAADVADFTEIEQTLDLWTGVATSRFKFRGAPVTVTTVAYPGRDLVAFRIESPLVAAGKLGATIRFSYPAGAWGPAIDDWNKPERHQTRLASRRPGWALFARTVDDWEYLVVTQAGSEAKLIALSEHQYRITWPNADAGELVAQFSDGPTPMRWGTSQRADFTAIREASAAHWPLFWASGGAIDLGGTDDPRAAELERRMVLSQYLTAIQNGSLPPQETGLATNSWFGKQHLEMHWWHAAHFPLWGREAILAPSLEWYAKILPQAQAIARRQGYAGARWPKMCGPDGVSSPSGVGEFLVWQQPHIIYLAELMHRANPEHATLSQYAALVEETAKFMADYVTWDDDGQTCHLGPPVIPAQENYRPRETRDPTFELAYWHWALTTAQAWRERAGLPREAEWDRVIAGLARPLVRGGRYAGVALAPFTNTADHPSMLCAYGVLPRTPLIDPAVMQATAEWVDMPGVWDWRSTWGWDFPVLAMTYARCGDPERAVDALLRGADKNAYLPNGHNYQEERLPLYLPGNGGLLAAAAMMAAGWDGADATRAAPGFPAKWHVHFEGLRPMP
jgi:hypothetical protein